ncbi:MAG: hypothetical protein H6636_14665 [Anaerolineales bacterium]|nr:hypothetical protein [Anaerolineales bacterium]
MWDARTLEVLYQLENGSGSALAIAWSPDGTLWLLLVLANQSSFGICPRVPLTSLTGHGSVSTLAWFPDGSF